MTTEPHITRHQLDCLVVASKNPTVGRYFWSANTVRALEEIGFLSKIVETTGFYQITDTGRAFLEDNRCYNGNHEAQNGICTVDGGVKGT